MIKAIIFDLDMCILDTHSLGKQCFQPMLDVLHSSDISEELKEKVDNQFWTTSIDDMAELFALPELLVEKMKEAHRHIEVPDGIQSFGDEDCLQELSVQKILVTTGFRAFQESKIAKLGVAHLFDQIIIDVTDNKAERKGKKRIFEDILAAHNWNTAEVLVVGDNPFSELGAAKELGITAVQTLRPTVKAWDGADYRIHSLRELQSIIERTP